MDLGKKECVVLSGLVWNSVITVNGSNVSLGEIYKLLERLNQGAVEPPAPLNARPPVDVKAGE